MVETRSWVAVALALLLTLVIYIPSAHSPLMSGEFLVDIDDFEVQNNQYILYRSIWSRMYESSGLARMYESSGLAVDAIISFGVVFVYAPQYLEIIRTRNADGFSLLVPLILLTSNILRIFYWVGERFALPLLIQAITTVLIQLAMLELCVRIRRESHESEDPKESGRGSERASFWAWHSFIPYLLFVCLFSIVVAGVTALIRERPMLVDVMGFVALGIEALLPVPQWWQNRCRQSTAGLSVMMVFTWFLSDALKCLYFLTTGTPLPFVVCGCLQCIVDVMILRQIVEFGTPVQPLSTEPIDTTPSLIA